MSEYYYSAGEDITVEKKSSGKLEKGLKRLLIIAGVIFAAQFIWLFGISPFFPFTTIVVQGLDEFSRNHVILLSGINENSSFFSTNVKTIQNTLSANVLVESAVVTKRFPDKLSIFITPREAAAVTLAIIDSKQVPIFIDKQGVFFKAGDSISSLELPILSGIDSPELGMRLPPALVPLMENLSEMAVSSPELLSAISEIRIERKAWEGYELVLFPVHSSIRVRIENNLTEEVLRYTLLILNVFESENQKPHEIDFRSGMGSYRL